MSHFVLLVWYLPLRCKQISYLGWGRESCFSAIVNSLFCCFCSRSLLFLWMLGKGCVILLWLLPGLPYNYYKCCTVPIQVQCEYYGILSIHAPSFLND